MNVLPRQQPALFAQACLLTLAGLFLSVGTATVSSTENSCMSAEVGFGKGRVGLRPSGVPG